MRIIVILAALTLARALQKADLVLQKADPEPARKDNDFDDSVYQSADTDGSTWQAQVQAAKQAKIDAVRQAQAEKVRRRKLIHDAKVRAEAQKELAMKKARIQARAEFEELRGEAEKEMPEFSLHQKNMADAMATLEERTSESPQSVMKNAVEYYAAPRGSIMRREAAEKAAVFDQQAQELMHSRWWGDAASSKRQELSRDGNLVQQERKRELPILGNDRDDSGTSNMDSDNNNVESGLDSDDSAPLDPQTLTPIEGSDSPGAQLDSTSVEESTADPDTSSVSADAGPDDGVYGAGNGPQPPVAATSDDGTLQQQPQTAQLDETQLASQQPDPGDNGVHGVIAGPSVAEEIANAKAQLAAGRDPATEDELTEEANTGIFGASNPNNPANSGQDDAYADKGGELYGGAADSLSKERDVPDSAPQELFATRHTAAARQDGPFDPTVSTGKEDWEQPDIADIMGTGWSGDANTPQESNSGLFAGDQEHNDFQDLTPANPESDPDRADSPGQSESHDSVQENTLQEQAETALARLTPKQLRHAWKHVMHDGKNTGLGPRGISKGNADDKASPKHAATLAETADQLLRQRPSMIASSLTEKASKPTRKHSSADVKSNPEKFAKVAAALKAKQTAVEAHKTKAKPSKKAKSAPTGPAAAVTAKAPAAKQATRQAAAALKVKSAAAVLPKSKPAAKARLHHKRLKKAVIYTTFPETEHEKGEILQAPGTPKAKRRMQVRYNSRKPASPQSE